MNILAQLFLGFYVNATQTPWNKNYQMYNYINNELPSILKNNEFQSDFGLYLNMSKVSIFGHSMGGHGALISYLRNDGLINYNSVSAFSPICNPINCRWGNKYFSGYLGDSDIIKNNEWILYDSTQIINNLNQNDNENIMKRLNNKILIDQGTKDNFLNCDDDGHNQLRLESFEEACQSKGISIESRWQEGYDHSYYFISSFVNDHIEFHCQHLL